MNSVTTTERRTLESLRPVLCALRSSLESLYGPRFAQMLVFGSYARGEADAESDVDILIALNGEVSPGPEISRVCEITAPLSLENDMVISCVIVPLEELQRGRSPLMINVRAEGIAA